MTADALLSRLDRVRETGPGKWIARCPAHDDRTPSLAIRETDDGRVLVHDFGGCGVREVVDALGLSLGDLFPCKAIGNVHPVRRPFSANDILSCVAHESLIVALAASRLSRGEELDEETRARLLVAASRIQAAVEAANG